jgi:hypothetical protein
VKIPSPIRKKFANELKFVDTSSKKVEDAEDFEYSTSIRTTLIIGALRIQILYLVQYHVRITQNSKLIVV